MIADELTGVLDFWLTARMEAIHTCIPGEIVTYEGHGTRRARVRPLVRFASVSGAKVDMPDIEGVPVVFPCSQAGGLVFPVRPRDGVLLVFSEESIGNYLNNAALGVPVDAEDATRFSLQDCIAIPGLFPFGAVPDMEAGDDEVVLAYGDSRVQLTPTTASLQTGRAVFQINGQGLLAMVNQASGMKAQLDALWGALGSLTQSLNAQFAALAGVSTGPLAPLQPPFSAAAGAMVAEQAAQTIDAAKVSLLLEDV